MVRHVSGFVANRGVAAVARALLAQCSRVARTIPYTTGRGGDLLWTIFAILLILWLLGMVSSYTLGGFIHILLVMIREDLVAEWIAIDSYREMVRYFGDADPTTRVMMEGILALTCASCRSSS